MFCSQPLWTFSSPDPVILGYSHAYLLADKAVAQWCAIDRRTGALLWTASPRRLNHIFDIARNRVLASEIRSDGAWTLDFGCYALSLDTGEMAWRWDGPAPWRALIRQLDRVPGYTNEFRPRFVGAKGDECMVTPDRVLDLKTGRLIRREADAAPFKKPKWPATIAQKLYNKEPVALTSDTTLTFQTTLLDSPGMARAVRLDFKLSDSTNREIWQGGPHLLGLEGISNFYGWRLFEKSLLFVASDGPSHRPDPRHPGKNYVIPNQNHFHFIVLDAMSGRVTTQFSLGAEKCSECRLEDVDENGILISYDRCRLSYHSRDNTVALNPTH